MARKSPEELPGSPYGSLHQGAVRGGSDDFWANFGLFLALSPSISLEMP